MTIKIEKGRAGENTWVMRFPDGTWTGSNTITGLLRILRNEIEIKFDIKKSAA